MKTDPTELVLPKDRITEADPATLSDRELAQSLHNKLAKRIDDLVELITPIHDAVLTAGVFQAIHDINNKLTGYAELAELLRGYANGVALATETQRKIMIEQRKTSKRLDLAGVPQGEEANGS